MTADVVKLPPADPIFALAPELKLHQSANRRRARGQ
jgi:hypothetical protein